MTSDKREKAIKYLTEEIRSLRLAPKINGCSMTPEWAEQISVLETCLEAVRAYHIGEDTEMVPLTLEQLREMDGQPVWGVSLINGKPGEWFIVRVVNMSKCWFIACAGASQGFGDKDTYGKTWLAYAYHPANIDREAWTAEWIYPESKWSLPRCSKCECNSKDAQYSHKDNFCPKCGRAMTPEGWAELEKRLRG